MCKLLQIGDSSTSKRLSYILKDKNRHSCVYWSYERLNMGGFSRGYIPPPSHSPEVRPIDNSTGSSYVRLPPPIGSSVVLVKSFSPRALKSVRSVTKSNLNHCCARCHAIILRELLGYSIRSSTTLWTIASALWSGWLGSRVAKALDLQLAGCEFNSRPGDVE